MNIVTFLFTVLMLSLDVPHYHLQPGLELNYSGTNTSKGNPEKKQAPSETLTKWQICVLGKNPNGSFRVVMFSQYGSNTPTRWEARRTDVFPDGRMVNESEPANSFGPNLLPPLPKETETTWSLEIERDKTECHFKKNLSQKGMVQFNEDRTGLMLAVYDAAATYGYTFDPSQGFIVGIRGARKKFTEPDHISYKYGDGGDTTYKVDLTGKTLHPVEWINALSKESDTYFSLKAAADQRYRQATKSPVEKAQQKIEESNAKWQEAKSTFKHPCFVSLVDDSVNNAANYMRWASDDAKRRATMLGQPVPAWEAKDFEGRSYSSETLRGKVVVLDFWYRGCGWCVRSMPQICQLANDMKDKQVLILGVNIDEDPEDAKFVIRRARLPYPNLEFHKESENNQRHPLLAWTFGYPTLLVIDREGKLADIHVGYSPTLRQEVGESIRQALAK
jgi:thiol-disulfide isomerase/thioredoxin